MQSLTIFIKNRNDKNGAIKEGIFAFSGGKKELLIKGEGQEISTAVEVAEILKRKLFPGIQVADITLGSRPFIRKTNYSNNKNKRTRYKKELISKIEILLKSKI